MLHQEKELPNDSGGPLSCNGFTDKKAKWLLLEAGFFFFFFFLVFCYSYLQLSFFEARVLQMTTNLELV